MHHFLSLVTVFSEFYKSASLFVLGHHWLPLATIDLVGDKGNSKFETYFEVLYPFVQCTFGAFRG